MLRIFGTVLVDFELHVLKAKFYAKKRTISLKVLLNILFVIDCMSSLC